MKIYSSFFCALALVFLSQPLSSSAQTATINAGTVYQTIDGFGAANVDLPALTTTQADLFFTTMGYSLLRVKVPDDGSCSSVNVNCTNQLGDIQKAEARGARVWAAPWSPPASMKTNGSTICNTGSGNGSLSSGSYSAYASYLSNYIASVQAQGSTIYGVSVQNEPDYCPTTYDGATWSAQNFHDFILNYLAPTMTANGQKAVKIIMPEAENWSDLTNMAATTMNDSAAAADVGILAFHGYDNSFSINNPYSGPHFWETEVSGGPGYGPSLCGGCWDPSMADALMWAGIIHYNLVSAHENAWNFWGISTTSSCNCGLTYNGVVAKRAYVLGNWAKFVRPSWVMIGATSSPQAGVQVSAFKDPSSGTFAIVAVNSNSGAISQSFALTGLSSSSVTPYLTDANNNLAAQSSIPVSGGSFTATLGGSSVTTFVSSGIAPGAPTNLTAVVQ